MIVIGEEEVVLKILLLGFLIVMFEVCYWFFDYDVICWWEKK